MGSYGAPAGRPQQAEGPGPEYGQPAQQQQGGQQNKGKTLSMVQDMISDSH